MLQEVFFSNHTISQNSIRWTWITIDSESTPKENVQLKVVFAVSKRNFAKASDRNRIKRLLRENLRIEKLKITDFLKQKDRQIAGALIYTGREMPDYNQINTALKKVLQRFYKEFDA